MVRWTYLARGETQCVETNFSSFFCLTRMITNKQKHTLFLMFYIDFLDCFLKRKT